MIHQLSTSLIKRLAPPGEAKTEAEKYLAQGAIVRRFTRFDLAIAVVILLDFVSAFTDSITSWWYFGAIELFLSVLLCALLIGVGSMCPLLGRLLLPGLFVAISEFFTSASGWCLVTEESEDGGIIQCL